MGIALLCVAPACGKVSRIAPEDTNDKRKMDKDKPDDEDSGVDESPKADESPKGGAGGRGGDSNKVDEEEPASAAVCNAILTCAAKNVQSKSECREEFTDDGECARCVRKHIDDDASPSPACQACCAECDMDSRSEAFAEGGADPKRNEVAAGELCERLSQLQCAGEAFCCECPGRTQEQCEATMVAGCKKEIGFDAAALNPVTGFSLTKAAVFFAQFELMAAACDPGITAFGFGDEGTASMFEGTRSRGESCMADSGGLDDTAAALLSCEDSATTACLPGLQWKCSSRGSGSCSTHLNCSPGQWCYNPNATIGKCRDQQAEGDACDDGIECGSLFCKRGKCVELDVQVAYCLDAP